MMTLAFLCGVAVLFAAVFVSEASQDAEPGLRPAGLVRWLLAGNWTAKLGGILLSIGTGALLRYLMLNINFPPTLKIMAGVAIAAVLGTAAALLASHPRRRAISLALSGAALAVAYLTAYSAYGFFHFVADLQALGMLFLVAAVATVVAISRRALSIAVLAMVGAYIAPAFALHATSPISVYGYYIAASLVTALMVWLRNWRALTHLSFLFTLAGALFFGWTQKFYAPEYYTQMQPMLLALVAVHLAMPLLETPATADVGEGARKRRFDQTYFLLLPLVAATLTLLIAPRLQREGALGLLGLGLLWSIAAGAQQLRFGQGSRPYLAIAVILLVSAGLLALTHVPIFLVIAVTLCLLIVAARPLQLTAGLEVLVIALALTSSACYVLEALFESVTGIPVLNALFARGVTLGAALVLAGVSLRRRQHALAPVFLIYAITWLSIVVARELFRLQFVHVAQIAYLTVLTALALYCIITGLRARGAGQLAATLFGVALFGTGFMSASQFAASYLVPLMLAGQILYAILAWQCDREREGLESTGAVARSVLPVLVAPWAIAFNAHRASPHDDVVWTFLVGSALFASLQAQWLVRKNRVWPNWLSPVGFVFFGALFFYESLLHIEREAWAVAFELIAVVYLVETARFLSASRNRDARLFSYLAIAAVAAVSAAMVLRLFGPPGTLTILALNDMLLPAIVSLLWAVIGALLTWFSTRNHSRTLWTFGAALLIAAAIKLVLFDFGSLGQIGNIIALMAAGGVFLLVSWLAPFPPKVEAAQAAPPPDAPPSGKSAPPAQGPYRAENRLPERGAAVPPRAPAAPAALQASAIARPPTTSRDASSGSRGWLWVIAALAGITAYAKLMALHHVRSLDLQAARANTTIVESRVSPPRPIANGVSSAPVEDACLRFVQRLPPDYLIYAAGDGVDSGESQAAAGAPQQPASVDVRVNAGPRNVVLAFGSRGPTFWRIHYSGGERIVGVIVSGAYRSQVVGVPASTPVLHAAAVDHQPCGYFQVGPNMPQGANGFVSKLLVRAVDANFTPTNAHVTMGDAVNAPDTPPLATSVDIRNAVYTSERPGHAYDVTPQLQSRCRDNHGVCDVRCGQELAGDPDFGHFKTCEIRYRCGGEPTMTAHVAEGQTFRLHCP